MEHNLQTIDLALKRFAITTSKEDFKALCHEVTEIKKELRKKYAKLCETRIANIGDDNQCFLIEEIFNAESQEILGQ